MLASAIRTTQEDQALPNFGGMAEYALNAKNGIGLQTRDEMTAAFDEIIEKSEVVVKVKVM